MTYGVQKSVKKFILLIFVNRATTKYSESKQHINNFFFSEIQSVLVGFLVQPNYTIVILNLLTGLQKCLKSMEPNRSGLRWQTRQSYLWSRQCNQATDISVLEWSQSQSNYIKDNQQTMMEEENTATYSSHRFCETTAVSINQKI